VSCPERNTDFAVGLEAADPRAMSCARINNDKRAPLWIYRHAGRRDNLREGVVDRAI
jgi:hypothetical protein